MWLYGSIALYCIALFFILLYCIELYCWYIRCHKYSLPLLCRHKNLPVSYVIYSVVIILNTKGTSLELSLKISCVRTCTYTQVKTIYMQFNKYITGFPLNSHSLNYIKRFIIRLSSYLLNSQFQNLSSTKQRYNYK